MAFLCSVGPCGHSSDMQAVACLRILLGTVSAPSVPRKQHVRKRAGSGGQGLRRGCPVSVSVVSKQPGVRSNPTCEGRAFIFEQRRALAFLVFERQKNPEASDLQCKAELQTSLGDRGVLYLASLQTLSPTAARLSLCSSEAAHPRRAADAFPSRLDK